MKKIFITGATGMVGKDVCFYLSDKYKIFAGTTDKNAKIKNCEMVLIDITDKENLIKTIEKIKPDYILHLAALTNVNLCEEKKELAEKINVSGTKNIVLASEKINAKLIYASTNYVFDGKKGMYTEEDIPNPVNFYSLTKLNGEKEVLKYSNSVVTRVCPFGLGTDEKPSFTTTIINQLRKNERINIFSDQFFSPISTYNYAEVLIKIFETNFTGLINIAGSERLSRYDFAKKIAEVFNLDSRLLNPIKINELSESAKRPKDTSLDISKAKNLFGNIFLGALSGIKLMKEYSKENKN